MDSLPPTAIVSPAPARTTYAASDLGPVGDHQKALCERASHLDIFYAVGLLALNAGSVVLDAAVLQGAPSAEVRMLGPAAIGLTWGATLGGGYLALPKCSLSFVPTSPPEGNTRSDVPVAIALSLVAGATAPLYAGIVTGTAPGEWRVGERAARLGVAAAAGIGGALLPYLLPPSTWAAWKELEHLRASGDRDAWFIGYSRRF